MVDNVGGSVDKRACIYQDTQETCVFSVGGEGLTQVEFDYEFTGDPGST